MAEKRPVPVVLDALLALGLVITYWHVITAALAIDLRRGPRDDGTSPAARAEARRGQKARQAARAVNA